MRPASAERKPKREYLMQDLHRRDALAITLQASFFLAGGPQSETFSFRLILNEYVMNNVK